MTHARTHTHGANYNFPPARRAGDNKNYVPFGEDIFINERDIRVYVKTWQMDTQTESVLASRREIINNLNSYERHLLSNFFMCNKLYRISGEHVFFHLPNKYIGLKGLFQNFLLQKYFCNMMCRVDFPFYSILFCTFIALNLC